MNNRVMDGDHGEVERALKGLPRRPAPPELAPAVLALATASSPLATCGESGGRALVSISLILTTTLGVLYPLAIPDPPSALSPTTPLPSEAIAPTPASPHQGLEGEEGSRYLEGPSWNAFVDRGACARAWTSALSRCNTTPDQHVVLNKHGIPVAS